MSAFVELPYSLHTRKKSVAIAWTVIIIPPTLLNIGLFYGLWYGKPDLDRITVLTLPTAILGIFTVLSVCERCWKLTRPEADFRPLNAPRYALDVFQWGYFLALLTISALISLTLGRGDADQDGHALQIRLMSFPAAWLQFLLANLTLISLVLNRIGCKAPFRILGNTVKPAVYYCVEDIVSVDGFGMKEFRKAWTKRYETSPSFRRMIWNLSIIWMVFFYISSALFTTLVFTLPVAAVYAVGWAGPFPLAGFVAIWTTRYVQRELHKERAIASMDEEDRFLE